MNTGKKLTKLYLPEKQGDKPLKRSLSGYELEMFTLDEKGNLTNGIPVFKKATEAGLELQKESAKSMVEVACLPHKQLGSTSLAFVRNMISLFEVAEKQNIQLYPFGTYPGLNKGGLQTGKRYRVLRKVLGEDFKKSGKVCGFHQHYSLPRGTFDEKRKMLHYRPSSKVKRTLIDSYNMLIAIDPVVCLLLQSSPYTDNVNLAKDSRLLLWRGGTKLKYKKGYAGRHFSLTHLQPYKQTLMDLIESQKRNNRKTKALFKRNKVFQDEKIEFLDFVWNPVKVNKLGTLECRSGDSNLLSLIFGVSTMIKFTLRKIQQDFTIVTPIDMEIEDSFKFENNMVFIPPHSIVRGKLQRDCAFKGFQSRELTTYTSNFFRFIKQHVLDERYEKYKQLLDPIADILEKKKTVSDKMIARAKRNGHSDKIPQEYAREMSLNYSKEFYKDALKIKDKLETTFE